MHHRLAVLPLKRCLHMNHLFHSLCHMVGSFLSLPEVYYACGSDSGYVCLQLSLTLMRAFSLFSTARVATTDIGMFATYVGNIVMICSFVLFFLLFFALQVLFTAPLALFIAIAARTMLAPWIIIFVKRRSITVPTHNFFLRFLFQITALIVTRKTVIIAEIQVGDSTHIHDHVIIPHSFSTINTICNTLQNPIPVLALLFFTGFLSFFGHSRSAVRTEIVITVHCMRSVFPSAV